MVSELLYPCYCHPGLSAPRCLLALVDAVERRSSTRCRTSPWVVAASATDTRRAVCRDRTRAARCATDAPPTTSTRTPPPGAAATRRRCSPERGPSSATVVTTRRASTANDVCRSTTTDRGRAPPPTTPTNASVCHPQHLNSITTDQFSGPLCVSVFRQQLMN